METYPEACRGGCSPGRSRDRVGHRSTAASRWSTEPGGDTFVGVAAKGRTPKRKKAAATKAMVALQKAQIPFAVHEYKHDPDSTAFGDEAAQALRVDPDRVFKTLLTDADGELVVACVPVSAQLSLKALAAAVGAKKATMADPKRAEKTTGYVLGGISPLGQRKPLPTILDASAVEHSTIFISGGRRGVDIEIKPDHLITATQARTAPLRA